MTHPLAAEIERRLAALRARLAEVGADAVLLSAPADVRWASAFTTPADARVVVTSETALLISDARYATQVAEDSPLEARIVAGADQLALIVDVLGGANVAVQADHLTLHAATSLEAALSRPCLPITGLTRPLRLVKSAEEIARLREAQRLTDAAFAHIVAGTLRAGVREVDVALELERFIRSQGGEAMAFEAIVASGPRSAMPHGVASQRVIERGDLVTLDFGARVDGYHADMTRAVAIGPISAELRADFDAVLSAQRAAVAAVAPGRSGVEVDAVARTVLAESGRAELFVHSLGHGVGLQIHEGPSLASRSTDTLAAGMVVTIEPGIYRPGIGGLRIEDLLLLTESGHEVLTMSPKDYLQV
jgi:Xaa-Pro aminopeptidase